MQLTEGALAIPSEAERKLPHQSAISVYVSGCIQISKGIEYRAERGDLSDDRLDAWMRLYHQARQAALSMPALTDADRAAHAVLALVDLERVKVRRDNDLAGMALLVLAEDLIARII